MLSKREITPGVKAPCSLLNNYLQKKKKKKTFQRHKMLEQFSSVRGLWLNVSHTFALEVRKANNDMIFQYLRVLPI